MDDLDDVLRRVAAGDLSPEDALAALDATRPRPPGSRPAPDDDPGTRAGPGPGEDRDPPPAGADGAGDDPGAGPDLTKGARRGDPRDVDGGEDRRNRVDQPLRTVRLRLLANAVDVYADASVAEVHVAGGSPLLRREGDVLVVEPAGATPAGPQAPFALIGHLPRRLAAALPLVERIVVRVNPALHLEVEATALALSVRGGDAGATLRLTASSAKLDGLSGPLSVDALSSSVKGSVRMTGTSRIACESSSVKLDLRPGSDVSVVARNRMGKVLLPDGRPTKRSGPVRAAVGAGTGRLTIDATMSSVMIGGEP